MKEKENIKLTWYVIGNPNSVFTVSFAIRLSKIYNRKVAIVARGRRYNNNIDNNNIDFINTAEYENTFTNFFLKALKKSIIFLETIYFKINKKRVKEALKSGINAIYRPYIATAIIQSISINRFLNKTDVELILVQDAFSFGPVALNTNARIKILKVWAGDIFNHAFTSKLAFKMVYKTLHSFDLIIAGNKYSKNFLIDVYGLDESYIKKIMIVEKPLHDSTKLNDIKKQYNIPKNKTIITNIRRFLPQWGSDLLLHVFTNLAKSYDNLHFILNYGGKTSWGKDIVKNEGVEENFTFIENYIEPKDYWNLLQLSDIGVSIVLEKEMFSASISQALYLELPLVVNKSDSYAEMKDYDLEVVWVNSTVNDIKDGIIKLLDKGYREDLIRKNRDPINKFFENISNPNNLKNEIDKLLKLKQCVE